MDLKITEVLGIGLSLIFGMLMIMIALGFLPSVYDSSVAVLGHANISDFTGAEETVEAVPTFITLSLLVVGIALVLGPVGVVGYKLFKGS